MSEVNAVKKKTLGDRFAEFKAMEGADKRRVISGALINNAMYIIIAIAVIFIAIKVPAFVRLPSIINIISLTAAKLPIALGIGGAIVLTGTDIAAGRCVGLTACIAASLLQVASYSNKMFPNLGVMPLWLVFLIVVAVGRRAGRTCQRLLRCKVQAASLHRHAVHAADRLRFGTDVPHDRH